MDLKTHANLEDLERRPNTQQHATLKTQSDLSINTWNKMQPSKEQKKSIASSTQNVTREDQK